MTKRAVAAIIVAAGCATGFEAVASSASDRAPVRPQNVSLVGCVARTPGGGFELANAMSASMAPRTGGSNSAKASTPVGNGGPIDRPRTAGPATAKGSVPIRVIPARLTLQATTGANSPKGSTPVARKPAGYSLDGADVAAFAGSAVAVAGVVERRVLTVETIRPIAGDCTR